VLVVLFSFHVHRPYKAREGKGDNKQVALWTEVECVNEENANATGCLNTKL
jgi:hypothetical protein